MKYRIKFKIKCALLRNLRGIIMEGKTKKRKPHSSKYSNTSEAHKRNPKLIYANYQNLAAFG